MLKLPYLFWEAVTAHVTYPPASYKATDAIQRHQRSVHTTPPSPFYIYSFLPLLLPTGQAGTEQIIERIVGLLVLLLLRYHLRTGRRGLGGCLLRLLLGGGLGRDLGRQGRLVVGVARFLGSLLLRGVMDG